MNTTKKLRIYSKTINKSVHPILTSPKRKRRLSKHSRKMTHGLKGKHGKEHQWVQLHYNQLLPTGNSSPPARFYGLPKIYKVNCLISPIVSACGMSTYNLAKYLTKILKVYIGHTSSFVKDSEDLTDKLKSISRASLQVIVLNERTHTNE